MVLVKIKVFSQCELTKAKNFPRRAVYAAEDLDEALLCLKQ